MLADANEVLSNLGSEFPEWAGMGYQIVGFGWHQGWNDKINSTYSAEYKYNLLDLISDLRAEFGKSTLPVAIATTGMGNAGDPQDYPYPDYSLVEKAQLWVDGVEQPVNVLSDDTRPYWRDASVSPSNFGYHWNHNAESQYLVGTGLGMNMTEILGDPNAPDVDAGNDKITWSGQSVFMDPNVVEKPASDWINLTYSWSATPSTGVSYDPGPDVKNPYITITKSTTNPSTVVVKLEVNDAGRTEQGAVGTLRIDVYDTACKAAIGAGVMMDNPEDMDSNCIVNLADFAIFAANWLNDGLIQDPIKKNN